MPDQDAIFSVSYFGVLKTQMSENNVSCSNDHVNVSGQPHNACTTENNDKVNDLSLFLLKASLAHWYFHPLSFQKLNTMKQTKILTFDVHYV